MIWDENIRLDDMFKFSLVTDVLKGLKYIHGSPFKYHGSLRSSSCVVDGRYVTAPYNGSCVFCHIKLEVQASVITDTVVCFAQMGV